MYMTKDEILTKTINELCEYESSKEIDYCTYLAIMVAMEEYAEQQIKESTTQVLTDSFCCICNNQLTNYELENNICIKCGNSPSPIKR